MIKAPYIINLAPTGVIPTKTMTPHVPVFHDEIVKQVAEAIEMGVQMVHLHARDDDQVQTADPDAYGQLVQAIRQLPGGKDLIVCVTASGRLDPSYASRSQVLNLQGDAKPDMASLTLSSLNFANSASINCPETIRKLATHMCDVGIKAELEVFDLGMANFIHVLAKEGRLQPPFYINVLLGNVFGAQPSLSAVAALMDALPKEAIVCFSGLGRYQLLANQLGLLYGDGVRTGIEDNIWFDQSRSHYASNAALVQRVKESADLLERELYNTQALRSYLQLERA